MAVRFKKKIARPGVVLPKNPLTRKREVRPITRDYLKQVAATGNEMLKEGILIPLPYAHTDGDGVYPIPLLKGLNGNLVDAKEGGVPRWDLAINAGFVVGWEIDPADGALVAVVEAEGDPNNQETHAGRIGKTYKQTSPLISDFLDGSGRRWKDAPLHIALTNGGVQHGQPDFELVRPDGSPNQELIAKQGLASPELAIAMAFDDEDYVGALVMADGGIEQLRKEVTGKGIDPAVILKIEKLLKEKLALTLPEDTTVDNFGDRLLTILTNMEPRKEGDLFTQMPPGSEILQAPIIMANPIPGTPAPQPGQPSPVPGQPNPTPPVTPPVNPSPSPTAPPPQQPVGAVANPDDLRIATARSTTLLTALVNQKKQQAKDRIVRLVKSGRIGRDYANRILGPQLSSMALALDDIGAEIPPTPLELALDMLEQTDALVDDDPPQPKQVAQVLKEQDAIIPEDEDDMGEGPQGEVTEDMVKKHYERTAGF